MLAHTSALCLSLLAWQGSAVTLEDETASMEAVPVRRQNPKRKVVSMSEDSSDSGADWASAEFAPTTSEQKRHDLITHGMTRGVLKYERHHGWDCKMSDKVALSLTTEVAVSQCTANCDKDLKCSCFQYDRVSKTCFTANMTQCQEKRCSRSRTNDMYLQRAKWTRDTKRLVRHQGKVCSNGIGSVMLKDKPAHSLAIQQCQAFCAKDADCTCFKYERTGGECTKMKLCDMPYCENSAAHDTYMHEATYNGYAHDYEGVAW